MLALSKFNLINNLGIKQGYDTPAKVHFLTYHRMVRVGKDLSRSSSPTPVYVKDEESKDKKSQPPVIILNYCNTVQAALSSQSFQRVLEFSPFEMLVHEDSLHSWCA